MNYNLIHDKIINKAISLNRVKCPDFYYEKHHILPKCLGGSNEKNNLVLLTAKEHYLIHRLLTFIYPNNKSLFFAFWNMINRKSENQNRYIISSKLYNETKHQLRIIKSNQWKLNNPNKNRNVTGANNPMYGTSRSAERNPFFKKVHTLESRLKISQSNKGKTGFHNIRAVIVDLVEYPTLTIAANTIGIPISTLYKRINNKTNFTNYNYK